jgi:hypothetical protein
MSPLRNILFNRLCLTLNGFVREKKITMSLLVRWRQKPIFEQIVVHVQNTSLPRVSFFPFLKRYIKGRHEKHQNIKTIKVT